VVGGAEAETDSQEADPSTCPKQLQWSPKLPLRSHFRNPEALFSSQAFAEFAEGLQSPGN
jgi:hypothetical protein